MLAVAIVALAVAAVSAAAAVLAVVYARRAVSAAEASVAEAKRSADAAEQAAGAATVTAEADKAADKRARAPRLMVTVDRKVAHDDTAAIFRVLNDGPSDLDSVIVHQPIVEEGIIHPVARTGCEYGDSAEVGPLRVTEYGRFTLSLGSRACLPDFRIRVTCRAGDESWLLSFSLENPREAKPVYPVGLGGTSQEPSIRDMSF